jgi:hypothetical protein
VLAAEHLLRLAGLDRRRQLVEPAPEIVGDRFTGLRPLDQDGETKKMLRPTSSSSRRRRWRSFCAPA